MFLSPCEKLATNFINQVVKKNSATKREKEETTAIAKSTPRLHHKSLLLVPSVLSFNPFSSSAWQHLSAFALASSSTPGCWSAVLGAVKLQECLLA